MKNKGAFRLGMVLVLGVCAGILRGIEVSAHFDWDTALYEPFAASCVVPLYTALMLGLIAVLSLPCRDRLAGFAESFPIRSMAGLYTAAGASLAITAMGLWKVFSSMQELRAVQILYGVLTAVGGAVLTALAKARHDGRVPQTTRFLSSFVIFWGCILLIVTYMEHPVEPVIRNFVYDILASAMIVMALLSMVSTIFGEVRRGHALFFHLGSVFLILMTIVGRLTAFLLSGDARNITDAPLRMLLFACVGVILAQNAAGLPADSTAQKTAE